MEFRFTIWIKRIILILNGKFSCTWRYANNFVTNGVVGGSGVEEGKLSS